METLILAMFTTEKEERKEQGEQECERQKGFRYLPKGLVLVSYGLFIRWSSLWQLKSNVMESATKGPEAKTMEISFSQDSGGCKPRVSPNSSSWRQSWFSLRPLSLACAWPLSPCVFTLSSFVCA